MAELGLMLVLGARSVASPNVVSSWAKVSDLLMITNQQSHKIAITSCIGDGSEYWKGSGVKPCPSS